ncbi:MAG: type II secretion system F family protein [Pseudomonadota bacterium]
MPNFNYIALNREGQEFKGVIDAPDLSEARRQLRAKTLMPVSLELGASGARIGAKSGDRRFRPTRFLWTRARDKQFFFRQMALMIQSGHRVRQALEMSAELVEREGLSRAIRRMVGRIDQGKSFSEAIRAEGRRFPAFVSALIGAGEKSGTLDHVLGEIATSLEQATELRNALLRALVLPSITLVVAFLVLGFIVLWLVPILTDFIGRQGGDIHWTMQILVNFTEFIFDYGPAITIGLGAATFLILAAYTQDEGRRFVDRVVLSLPIFGLTLRLYEMSRLGGIGTLLLTSGLRQVETLKVLSDVTQNYAYRARYLSAADDVLTGERVSDSLKGGIFPDLVRHMISVGELSGNLDEVFSRIGVFYADEVATRVRVLLSTLVPAMTIAVGVIVGIIYISVILTILGAYNSVR